LTFSLSTFRGSFPEFGDTTKYPDAMLNFWLSLAMTMVPQHVWRNQWVTGVSLYIAHEITLAASNKQTAANGGTPGQNSGIANSKAVGGVNVSYDSQSNSEKNAGYWNLTNYGKQFLRLARIFGARPIQL